MGRTVNAALGIPILALADGRQSHTCAPSRGRYKLPAIWLGKITRMNAFPQSPVVKKIVWRSPSSTTTRTPFPPDLLRSASKRLALLGIVISAIIVVFVVLSCSST